MPDAILRRTMLPEHELILRRFEDAWRRGERPSLDDYLAAPSDCPALLAELVHLDLAYRCRSGEAARLEEYLSRYPQLAGDRGLLLDFIATEFQARQPECSMDEYRHRFPEVADELKAPREEPRAQDTQAQV